MNPEAIINKICTAIDLIIKGSRAYKGVFPSILHAQTGDMLMEKTAQDSGSTEWRPGASRL